MKKLQPLLLFILFLCSCKNTLSPKETAQKFITALSSSDLATASSLISNDTKAVLDKAKKQTQQTMNPEESFQLASLTETTSGSTADVRNEIITVPLVKEDDGWKVVLHESLLNEIQNRDEMLETAKEKWNDLLKEYEARLQVLREYIKYKKSLGSTSVNIKKLSTAVDNIKQRKEWSSGTVQEYVQKQHELNSLIENALEPSQAANTDLSLNYFLQISNANDRIKAAQDNYQDVAAKAHSPVYKPLPFAAASSKNKQAVN